MSAPSPGQSPGREGFTKIRNCTREWRRKLTPVQWGLICVAIDRTAGWQKERAAITYSVYAEEANVSLSTAKQQVPALVGMGVLRVVGEEMVEVEDGVRRVAKVYEANYAWTPPEELSSAVEARRERERGYKRTRKERGEAPRKPGRPPRGTPVADAPGSAPGDAHGDAHGDARGLNKNPQEDGAWGLNKNPRRGLPENPQGGYLKTPKPSGTPLGQRDAGHPKERKERDTDKTSLPSVGRPGETDRPGWVEFKERAEHIDAARVEPWALEAGNGVGRLLAGSKLDVAEDLLSRLAQVLGEAEGGRMERVARKLVRYSRRQRVDDPWKLFASSVWRDLDENPSPGGSGKPDAGKPGVGGDAAKTAAPEHPEHPELESEIAAFAASVGGDSRLANAGVARGADGGKLLVALNTRHADQLRRRYGEGLEAAGWRIAEGSAAEPVGDPVAGAAVGEKGEVA